MSKHENELLNQRQNATSERSAAMRLSPEVERALYQLYRAYFRAAEAEGGRDSLWRTLDSTAAGPTPSQELAEAALIAYRQDLFLPDYNTASLVRLRGSRGRAWFWTRWSYEESRHLLALHEWLLARGVADQETLSELSDDLLGAQRWSPASDDALYLFVDALLWELTELARGEKLLAMARAEGDEPLEQLLVAMLADEAAQRDFFLDALKLVRETYPERINTALSLAAAEHESATLAAELSAYLDASPTPR